MKLPAANNIKPMIDHRLAPVTVGQPPRRNLQDRLCQPICTQRDTDQKMALPARQVSA